ncbi:uncharacterized protein LOC141607626 [Silene latifolia]|uniref:uncharacterized protein LOC141607626 n=1 Tax=Silene latifolia TaxID=37657 RepID=UPI003D780712
MEVLSRLLRRLPRAANFSYHPKCVQLNLTHLVFADDLLVFIRGDLPSVKAVADCLDTFSHFSGLHANPSKTDLYFGGVAETVRDLILDATGNALLVNSVIFGLHTFWGASVLLPKGIAKRIIKLCKDFLWGIDDGWISTYVLKGTSLWDAQQTVSNSWYWNNMKYRTDTMYGYLRTRRPLVPWAPLIHGTGSHPKHSFTGMLVMNNGLPNLDKLISRGMCFINRCVLCECSYEDIPHLFFECEFSKSVLIVVAQWVQMPLGSFSLAQIMQTNLPTRRNVKQHASLLATIYYLWKERNDRSFKGPKSTVDALSIVIRKVVTLRLYGSNVS